ncbi:peptidase M48 Ste24p [Haloarcula sp. CBA1130]|uniref:M48 family metalloprotease n=1 Tax=unclassified Haloarcula TaxID=2624677 RepID=UPI0012470F6C|nr:peptidase M48 Ste24p [Haloarcula sp. CBA1129]KAA9404029.1 peptidase M48 Ste24p [Haloarcula sp. CBA1130]
MGVAVVLVGLLPVGFVYAGLAAMNTAGIWLAKLATDWVLAGRFYLEPWLVVGVVLVGFATQFTVGDTIALQALDARPVSADDRPALVDSVARLSQSVDLPTPSIAVADSDAPNAFTVGGRTENATLVVTTGLLDVLDATERDAVIAHELAHIKNRDATVMSLSYLLPSFTYSLAGGTLGLLQAIPGAFTGFHHTDSDSARSLLLGVVILTVSALLTLAISAVFWLASVTLFRVLSRYREYAADRGAVAITGDPAALASALETIDTELTAAPDRDLRAQDGGLGALCIAPIDDTQFADDPDLVASDVFPETHPPTEARIERLEEMAGAGTL